MPEANRLLIEVATHARVLTPSELERVLNHVAQAGFDTTTTSPVGRLGSGVTWHGRLLRASDRLPPDQAHYVRHVLGAQEWPPATTFQQYLQSVRDTVLDSGSGVLIS